LVLIAALTILALDALELKMYIRPAPLQALSLTHKGDGLTLVGQEALVQILNGAIASLLRGEILTLQVAATVTI